MIYKIIKYGGVVLNKNINFDKELNISYIDEKLEKPSNELIWKHYFCSVVLYFFIYVFLCNNPFFKNYFVDDLKIYYSYAYFIYFLISPIIFFIFKPKSIHVSHSINIFNYFGRLFKKIIKLKEFLNLNYKDMLQAFVPTYHEKQAIMLIFIKIFFGTLMASFLYNNMNSFSVDVVKFKEIIIGIFSDFSILTIKTSIVKNADFLYKFSILVLFSLDIAVYLVGYLTEAMFLKNKIKTIDTNVLHTTDT